MRVSNSSVAIDLDNGGANLGVRMAGHPATMARSVAEMAEHVRTHFGPARYDDWVAKAQPGAQQIYGVGVNANTAAGPGVAARMRELSAAGLVTFKQHRHADRPADYRYDYVAVRTGKPLPKGFPALPMPAFRWCLLANCPSRKCAP